MRRVTSELPASGLPCLLQSSNTAAGTRSNERKSLEETQLTDFVAEVSASVDLEVAKSQAEAFAKEDEEVIAWCKRKGYAGIKSFKVTLLGRKAKFPLHTAVEHQNVEMVALLVKHGADKGARDSLNFTPRHYASMVRDKHVREAILSQLDC